MSFISNFFKKKSYSNILHFEDTECTRCNNVPYKLKKCHDCKSRNICKKCYKYEDLILCKKCNDIHIQWQNKILNIRIQMRKEEKYGVSNNKNHSFLDIEEIDFQDETFE